MTNAATETIASAPRREGVNARLNWLRAGVLGADDGIVSVAAVVVGVAGATSAIAPIAVAGAAALFGGAISMALGEYVSVSSSKDSTLALVDWVRGKLRDRPQQEFDELTGLYQKRGLTRETAQKVAEELTAADPLAAHLDAELGISQDDIASPWHAAWVSALSFTLGAILPMAAILLPPEPWRIPITFVAVLVALAATGAVGARLGGANPRRATLRVVVGGALALAVTYGIGRLLGVSGI